LWIAEDFWVLRFRLMFAHDLHVLCDQSVCVLPHNRGEGLFEVFGAIDRGKYWRNIGGSGAAAV
jgi:hypothetical protein